MAARRCTQRAVEQMFQNRHDHAAAGGVESAVRVAGGIPTLGWGVCAARAANAATASSVSAFTLWAVA